MRILSSLLLALALVTAPACKKLPPDTPTNIVVLQRVDEAVVAIGTVQHAAIELNKVQVCPSDQPQAECHPLLADADVRVVGDAATDALLALKQTGAGWQAVVKTALDRISARLSEGAKAKLEPYLFVLRTFL